MEGDYATSMSVGLAKEEKDEQLLCSGND